MKVSFGEARIGCANCGREQPASKLDRRMWCPDCRAAVVRKSARVARLVALITAVGLTLWIFTLVGSAPRFLIVYVVMVVAAYFFIYKLTQRVAFELIRSRGVPPPEPGEIDG